MEVSLEIIKAYVDARTVITIPGHGALREVCGVSASGGLSVCFLTSQFGAHLGLDKPCD